MIDDFDGDDPAEDNGDDSSDDNPGLGASADAWRNETPADGAICDVSEEWWKFDAADAADPDLAKQRADAGLRHLIQVIKRGSRGDDGQSNSEER
jgi:hypothetical protein